MPPNKMTLKDLENFLSSRRSAPREGGGLSKAASALRRAEQERQAQRSVFNQPREPEWQPDYERPGGHALEAPMISPDDLFGTGIPTKIAMALKGAAPLIGGLGVIKNKGGNWLSGSVEGALSGLKKPQVMLYGLGDDAAADAEKVRSAGLNSFIDKQLTRYVKNDMATPEDPIRALAERGVLHYEPHANQPGAAWLKGRTPVGTSDLAKTWDAVADQVVGFPLTPKQAGEIPGNLANNPWLEKLGEDVPVFAPRQGVHGSGFDHLTDELANALSAHSQGQKWNDAVARARKSNLTDPVQIQRITGVTPPDLPTHLQLDPKSMDRVSVPQAVERVSQINAWRAAQKAEADALKANNAATHLHKDYPDKGFKWVELRHPEAKSLEDLTPQQQEWYHDYLAEGVSPEGAVRNAAKRGTALQDALKYEGDTMGHCVGGYCDDVASGRSRIYSLRDAKGQPHVTVEVLPGYKTLDNGEVLEVPDSIVQIKGKANRAPNEEYLPFVQDFVKSGKWSDVGDLQNSGLQRAGWAPDVLERMKAHGIEAPEYGTADEINAALNALNKAKGFAHGGTVDKNNLSVQQLSAIIAQLRQEHINAA